ncbi:MAG TPA: TRZ/ATZ family hydrolase [Candidatus Acidoferrales bacterium]|nr:TRZ/ATZ family hydrolase [Candidatus Acidoferrales bacterium]
MEAVDTLLHAAWIIPVEPEGAVWPAHSLAIRDGHIVAVLPQTEARLRFTAATEIHLPRQALIPGLVNAHTHGAMNLLRGLADDLPLMSWLGEHIWPAEQRWVDAAFVEAGSRLAIAEMIKGGTTCFNDMYFFPEQTARVAADCGVRACVGMIALDFPTRYAADADDYLAKGLALHDAWRGHPLVRTAFAPHAPYTVSDAPLRRIKMLSDELDVPIHMHVHETAGEVTDAVARDGRRPLQRLDELGMLGPNFLAVHMTQLLDAEIDLLARTATHVLHCPESNLKLASGFCPIARLLAGGVNVALGTDGAASNNDLDLLAEMRTAALLAKGVSGDAAAVPAFQALQMATLNGARALGLADEIGSLRPGKWADVVAVDLGGLDRQPLYHPLSQLVYTAHRDHVTDVWVAGRPLLRAGVLTHLDEAALIREARDWGIRIATTPQEHADG